MVLLQEMRLKRVKGLNYGPVAFCLLFLRSPHTADAKAGQRPVSRSLIQQARAFVMKSNTVLLIMLNKGPVFVMIVSVCMGPFLR